LQEVGQDRVFGRGEDRRVGIRGDPLALGAGERIDPVARRPGLARQRVPQVRADLVELPLQR